MPTDIIMPQLGESIAEGTVVKWLIQPGGRVEKDASLLEVETDKVALEIPSPAGGVLTEVIVQEGQTVPVGTLLGRLNAENLRTEVVNRVGGVVVRPMPGGTGHYSPAVRQLAHEHEVDLAHLAGTGAGGRVTKQDVLDYIGRHGAMEGATTASVPSPAPTRVAGEEDIVPFSAMRRTIAERMVHSRRTSAHVTTFFEADMTAIAMMREGKELTYLPFLINAVARALGEIPILNSSWGSQGIMQKREIHIGIAVALDDGLLVPVVRHAERKAVTQVAKEVTDLAERARTKRLAPEEVQGGGFTITNHGGFGSLFSTPIIHQPQIAILGVGSIHKRPVVINDAIAIRPMCYLSLSFDHRVIDGATADTFMSKVKSNLEKSNWETYL